MATNFFAREAIKGIAHFILWKEEMVEKNQEVRQQTCKYKFPVNGRSHDLTRALQYLFLQTNIYAKK